VTSHPSPIEPDGLLDGLRWGSILLGALVDNVLTVLGASSPEFLLAGLVVGVCATSYGAFVGARRAGVHHVRHGGWIAVCSAALSLVPVLLAGQAPASSPPLWYEALGWLLLLPSGLAGGYLAERLARTPSS
jgi:hypothetical protein